MIDNVQPKYTTLEETIEEKPSDLNGKIFLEQCIKITMHKKGSVTFLR